MVQTGKRHHLVKQVSPRNERKEASQSAASTSRNPYSPTRNQPGTGSGPFLRKRKGSIEGQKHGPPGQAGTPSASGKRKVVVKMEEEESERGPASFYPSPSSPSNRHQAAKTMTTPSIAEVNAIPTVASAQSHSRPREFQKDRAGTHIVAANREDRHVKRPKIEEMSHLPLLDNQAETVTSPDVTVQIIAPRRPPAASTKSSPVSVFLLQTCKPPLPAELLTHTVNTFESFGVKTEKDLKALASAGDALDFWMQNARKEGLSLLWEAIVRNGLKTLLAFYARPTAQR